MEPKRHNIGELNRIYQEAEHIDRALFAEQRSHVLLIAGEHYHRRGMRYQTQIRDNRDLTDYNKLRLTKNHIYKVHKRQTTALLRYASGVTIAPQLDAERQDQKDAELNKAVWEDAKNRYRLREKIRKYASDFCGIGEVCVIIKWDPNGGEFLGHRQATDELGMPAFNEDGSMVPDISQPVFRGEFMFERIFGYNLMRDPGTKDMGDNPVWVIRKMEKTSKLKERYKDDPKKKSFIGENVGDEFVVFDATRGGYDKSKGQTLVKEYYYKPCHQYPNGYFYITTEAGILEEGELPFGIWPIVYQGCDEHPSSPRGRSPIKQARPYQAEINRAASQQALHQITLGDDKVLYQAGTRLAHGALLPGVRGVTYQGQQPTILPGRDGSQYDGYIQNQIGELYNVLDVPDLERQAQESQAKGGNDLYSLLFRSAIQRQNQSLHSEKFEQFLMDFCETFLKLAQKYYTDDMLIPAIGRHEMVNIAEFRRSDPFYWRVKIEPQDDTLETKFGKQLTYQHLIQYAGKNLSREDIGMLARQLPFANNEEIFKDFTADYDGGRNMLLALERGEFPETIDEENHDYFIKVLSNRMKESDFRFLDPNIQELHRIKRQEHQIKKAEREQRLLKAQSEYIPADGPMIACDMYIENEEPGKAPKRARLPQRALRWLVEMLEAQNGSLQQLEQMNGGTLAGYQPLLSQMAGGPGAPTAPGLPPQGQASPGVMQ